jgi:hypothetical protein
MPVVDPRIAGTPVPRISKERMERECVARVKNVEALDVAMLFGVGRPTAVTRVRITDAGRRELSGRAKP